MGGSREPPPGGGGMDNQSTSTGPSPDQRTNSVWTDKSVFGGNITTRSFEQIIADEKKHRNILEIRLVKNDVTNSDGTIGKAKSLNFDDIGEFLFDILCIDPESCISFNFSTGRYDQREIKFKSDVDISPYVRVTPVIFKDHSITVKKQRQNITRVTFKNVPLNVPGEEILTLCACYGKPVETTVQYERLNNIKGRGLTGSTRHVDMQLNPGVSFENYYWMEGPLPGDVGRRVVVLHNGQTTQCSHCLRRAGAGCPAMGIGKACELAGTPRTKMNSYMQGLRSSIGYVSMKIKYIEKQAKMFPSLIGLPGERSSEQEVAGAWSMDESEQPSHSIILNPIEERDKLIFEQSQEIEKLKSLESKCLSVTNELQRYKGENSVMKKKINFTRKATEERTFENISNKDFYRDDPLLVAVLSATLNEDDFFFENVETDETENHHVSRKEQFLLESLESKIDKSDSLQLERLSHVRNQIIEKIKTTKMRRNSNSKRRLSMLGIEDEVKRSTSRPRTDPPPIDHE